MRCPFAIWRPLPENATQRRITPTQVIVHTAVDAPGPSSLYAFFARGDVGAESHFFVKNDGVIEQYMDTEVMANANRKADVRAISIETEDDGRPEEHRWTPAQVDALVRLVCWANEVHGVPVVLCPSPDAPGVGYHSQWGFKDPVNKTGPLRDNPWSIKYAKTCPGRLRTIQFLEEVLPAAQFVAGLDQNGEDMTPQQATQLEQVWQAIFGGTGGGPIGERLREIHEGERAVRTTATVAPVDIDALAKKVADELAKRLAS